MSRRAARLERLDDDHATTATWAGMDRLVCRLGASGRLILLRRVFRRQSPNRIVPSTSQRLLELNPNVEQPGRLLDTDDVDFVSGDDHLEDNSVLPRSLPHDGSRVPLQQTSPIADADACGRQLRSAVAAAHPGTGRAAPRASTFLLIASSALGLLSVAAAWIALSGSSTTPMAVDLACTRSEQSSPCPQAIVTGAIGKVDQPQSPEPGPSAAFATRASFELISSIEQSKLSATQIPKTATTSTEREDASEKIATTPKTLLQNVSADRHDCHELRAASQSINIPFDYASSRLKQEILPALEFLCSEAAVLSVDQSDYRRPHRFRRACSLEPVAIGSSGQSGAKASCLCRRTTKSVGGDWIRAIPPLRTQRVDQEQAQQPTSRVACRCSSLNYVCRLVAQLT